MLRQLEITYSSLEDLPDIVQRIISFAGTRKVFAFYGDMGAGKTTIIKEFCQQLGVNTTLSSPTYNIVNEYVTNEGLPVFHMDLYRIKSVQEAQSIGIEEYLYSGLHCFIEWPSIIEHILSPDVVKIDIRVADGFRNLSIFTQ